MPTTMIPLPADPASLDLGGDPRNLPDDTYQAIVDLYATMVADTREPCSSVLATARMVTETARFHRWGRERSAVLGDLAALLCQRICDDTIAAID
jgi:hypothetical protein